MDYNNETGLYAQHAHRAVHTYYDRGQSIRLSSSHEDELDLHAIEIIEKSLELLNSMLGLLRESTRAGGHILQNFITMAAWILTTGLLMQLTNTSQVRSFKNILNENWTLHFLSLRLLIAPRAAVAAAVAPQPDA